MRLFEPEDAEQVQEVQAWQDQTALTIDYRAEEFEDNTQQLAIDHPEEKGDTSSENQTALTLDHRAEELEGNTQQLAIDHPEEKGDTSLDNQTVLTIDQELEGDIQQLVIDHPEKKGDTSLDTITPDYYTPANNADEQGSETQDEHQEGQLDPMSDTDSMERDYSEAAEDNQAIRESGSNAGYSEIPALHWTEYADPHADPFIAFCKFFAKGRCKNGVSCTYRHALTVQEFFLLFRQEPFMWSPQVPVPEEYVEEVAPVQPPLQPPLQTSTSLGVCAFYSLGKCRNGKKCPYAHIVAPDTGE